MTSRPKIKSGRADNLIPPFLVALAVYVVIIGALVATRRTLERRPLRRTDNFLVIVAVQVLPLAANEIQATYYSACELRPRDAAIVAAAWWSREGVRVVPAMAEAWC
jgi:hypothetical protein